MTLNVLAVQPGAALTGSMTAVAAPTVGTVLLNGWVANGGTATVTLAAAISRGGAAPLAFIPAKVIAAMSNVPLPEVGNLALSNGDTLTASGAGLVLYLNGFTVTA